MKFNISYPQTGQQKCIEIDDEKQYRVFYDKRMGQEVDGEVLGDQFKGYVFRISGGNDKQGFPMKQGILCNTRVRVLMKAGHSCYRPRRAGERKRKSVRGCIVGPDIRVLALVVVKKGEDEIEGLTNETRPRRLGPKRATRIRKLFGLEKPKKGEDGKPDPKPDEVRHFVIRREITKEGAKSRWKAPKIQRLVTPQRLRRKRVEVALKKTRKEATKKKLDEYKKLVATYHKQKREDKKNEQKEDQKVTKETARPQTQKS